MDIRELLRKKYTLFETLLQYCRKQVTLSYLDHPSEYRGLIKQKEQCIQNIIKNDTLLKQEQLKNTPDVWQSLVTSENSNLEIMELDIRQFDEQCRVNFAKEMQTVKDKLNIIHRGKNGIKGYKVMNPKMNSVGSYTDKRR